MTLCTIRRVEQRKLPQINGVISRPRKIHLMRRAAHLIGGLIRVLRVKGNTKGLPWVKIVRHPLKYRPMRRRLTATTRASLVTGRRVRVRLFHYLLNLNVNIGVNPRGVQPIRSTISTNITIVRIINRRRTNRANLFRPLCNNNKTILTANATPNNILIRLMRGNTLINYRFALLGGERTPAPFHLFHSPL